jgi:hypothetical protein
MGLRQTMRMRTIMPMRMGMTTAHVAGCKQ